MTKTRHITHGRLAAGAALAVVALGAVAIPTIASTSGDTRARTFRVSRAPVPGVAGWKASISTRLSFPLNWRVTSNSKGTLTLREGQRGCTYTVKASSRVAPGDEGSSTERTAALLPASGPYVLEIGTRNLVAWRVIRVRETQQIHLEAVRATPLGSASRATGHKLWLETKVSARSDVGDECHSGTYREGAGTSIGDSLATARARAYVQR
jgi:hypothetical protein